MESYTLDYAHPGSQLKDHIYERSRRLFAAGEAARDALQSPDAVRRRQEEIRRNFAASLGGLPSSDTPLNARATGIVPGRGFTIEKVIFESRPRHYVTANLYLPHQRTGRTAAVLLLCGHNETAKLFHRTQNVCQTLVQAGLIVFAIDPIGQGERLSYYEAEAKKASVPASTRDHDYAGAQARFIGDSLGRYFLHDAMRGVDYLLTRPEVDPAKIGVTGSSGGGTQTSLMMLVDTRIAAAAPATFITNRESYQRTGQPQDAEQIWPGFTRAGYDHEDILLAIAPKPVCVLAVTSDFFPIEGTRRTVSRSRRIWSLFDRANALELVEDRSTHAYTPALQKAAARFFAKHLLGRDVDLAGFNPEPFPEEKLRCTESGQVRGELAGAEFVFEATAARFKEAEAHRGRLAAADRRPQALQWLRTQVFNDREANDANPRLIERAIAVDDFEVDVAFWWPQRNLANLGMLIRPRLRPASQPVTIAIWDHGTRALAQHADWLRAECGKGRAVFVVNLSGVGPLVPDPINSPPLHGPFGTFHKLADDLTWIGDSLVALRTYETLRAFDVLAEWPELATDDVRFYGHGRMGVHAKLAASLDRRVAGCEWAHGFKFADFVRPRIYDSLDVQSVILPGVLRYFDVEEL
ncbi:MAG: acetylxylan esterase [Verrucomicrobia bacterium]|nr:acetylxylan esterase [Verrucomicrobiota bacterium]